MFSFFIHFKMNLVSENTCVPLEIPMNEVVKVLIHFGKNMPVLFYYTTPQSGAKIREILGMQDPKSFYYDPAGKGKFLRQAQ